MSSARIRSTLYHCAEFEKYALLFAGGGGGFLGWVATAIFESCGGLGLAATTCVGGCGGLGLGAITTGFCEGELAAEDDVDSTSAAWCKAM